MVVGAIQYALGEGGWRVGVFAVGDGVLWIYEIWAVLGGGFAG